MKSIRTKSLILLSIIILTSLFSTTNTKKVISKTYSKEQSCDYGSGDMVIGFTCPFIELYNEEDGTKISTTGKYSFKPREFSANLGFIIILQETDMNLNKFLKVHKKDTVYIPWRYFNSAEYYKKTASYKILEVILRNDNGEKIKAKFNLPWKFSGNVISEKEINLIIGDIEKYRGIQRNNINRHKSAVEDLSDELFKFKTALKSQALSAAIFKVQTEKRIRTNQAILIQKRRELAALDKKLNLNKRQHNLLLDNYHDVRDTMNKMQVQNDNNLMLMDDGLRATLYADMNKKVVDAKDSITTDLHKLAATCKNVNLENLKRDSMVGNVDSVGTLLQGIQPN